MERLTLINLKMEKYLFKKIMFMLYTKIIVLYKYEIGI